MQITKEQYDEAIKQKASAETVIQDFFKQKDEAFAARLASGSPFTDEELVYSAYQLCPCGHGIAYPKDCTPHHYWDCSAILKGIGDNKVTHTGKSPFNFYDVKSESQPSAQGSTTRGVFKPQKIQVPNNDLP